MHFIRRIQPAPKATLVLASSTFFAGIGGMVVSYCFLASRNQLDVVAGASGFVAGAILVAAGLLSIAIVARGPGTDLWGAPATSPALAFASPQIMPRWMAHFRRNREHRPEPDWNAPVTLAADVVRPLVKSLEQFQLGDGGGPACLIAWNAEQVRSSSAGARAVVDLWFIEEREHARLLAAAVARFGGRCIHGHWSFTAFCLSRKYFGVRFELTVLLLTEIVSTVYYRLLRRHGQDPALRSMCRLILRDEMGHVAFHRARLASLARNRMAPYGRGWEIRFRLLGLAAASMLWVNHAPALNALGATAAEFYLGAWRELSRFLRRLRHESQGDLATRYFLT